MEWNVKSLRRELAHYLSRVEDGDEITVTRNGRAIARIVPLREQGRIDIEGLRRHQEELHVKLDHNPILRERGEERY